MYKAKVAVCSDIRTKHSTQSERHVEFLNVKPWRYVKKPLGFKRLIDTKYCNNALIASEDCRTGGVIGRYTASAVRSTVESSVIKKKKKHRTNYIQNVHAVKAGFVLSLTHIATLKKMRILRRIIIQHILTGNYVFCSGISLQGFPLR